ncbi:MAG: hypothetical protein AABZ30_07165 [Myxococcota bacterium]
MIIPSRASAALLLAGCGAPEPEFHGETEVVVGERVTLEVLRGDGFGETPEFGLEDGAGATFSGADVDLASDGNVLSFRVPAGIASGSVSVRAGPYAFDLDVRRLAVGVAKGGAVALRDAAGEIYFDAEAKLQSSRVRVGADGATVALVSREPGAVQVFDLTRDPPAASIGRIDFAEEVRDAVVVGDRLCVALPRGLCIVRLGDAPALEGCTGGDMRGVAAGPDDDSAYAAGAIDCDVGVRACDGLIRVNLGVVPVVPAATWILDEAPGGVVALAVGDEAALIVDVDGAEAALRAVSLGALNVASMPLTPDLAGGLAAAGGGRFLVGGATAFAEATFADGVPSLGAAAPMTRTIVGLALTRAGDAFVGFSDGFGRADLAAGSVEPLGEWIEAIGFGVQP